MSTHIDEIIMGLGYAESSCLKYSRDGYSGAILNAHNKKVLDELAPYAVFIVDNAPFVLFYEEIADKEEQKRVNKKIWNAQIPITIVCGTGDVIIYSSCSINRKEFVFDEVRRLSINEIDDSSPFSYWEITRQSFWVEYVKQFSGKTLNDLLLRNLSDISKKLRVDHKVAFSTKLILRLIFIRYLIDRGVDIDYEGFSSDVDVSRKLFINLLSEKVELYKLFSHLKEKFNGNLFELDDELDDPCLTADVLSVLTDFFSANLDTTTRQLSLFNLYDFNIIPVELISNIYEILLGKESRDKDSAFYTPQYLVKYVLDGSISSFIRDNGACKVLDPSCGSGIFLVESYRRIVEKELNGDTFTDNDELLQNILLENIYGIDLNKDAIDVAIFSLYLAVLDYKNPRTLKEFKLPNLKSVNLFIADFFDDDALRTLKKIQFDFIIGNPPWGKGTAMQIAYYNKNQLTEYDFNHDSCRAFIFRSKNFSRTRTQCCFILHSKKILYIQNKPSKKFREFLLRNTKISRIFELSSIRELLFKDADAPAVILEYSFPDDISLKNRFEYTSMKPNLFFKLFSIIVVEKTDIKYVQQSFLAKNDWAWKTLVYGLSGDIDVISYLRKTFSTMRQTIKKQHPELITKTGVQYNDGDRKDASKLYGRDFLPSESVDHFSINLAKMKKFEKTHIHRPRTEDMFHAPYCLLLKGLDMSNFTMRSVFSEDDFVFKEAIYAIKGCNDQKSFLLNLTGLLNSTFYSYLNFMVGSSLGIEREQRFIDEILGYPYEYSSEIVEQVELIQRLLKREDFTVAQDTSGEIEKLNKMIFEAFNLADNPFIDYALNVQIPQLTGTADCKAFCAVTNQELCSYIKPFLEMLSAEYNISGKYLTVNVYPDVANYYSAVEIVLHNRKQSEEIRIINAPTSTQSALTRFSVHKINDMFFEVKDIIHFEEDSFYIIKSNYYKNWHPAIAEIDVADVIDQILSRTGGND